MALIRRPAHFYTQESDKPLLEWKWVEQQLVDAGTYWVVAADQSPHPHPRPVWGVWHDECLYLSIGTPSIVRAISAGSGITVHLDSGIDVVIVEGDPSGSTVDPEILAPYDRKYDWKYDAETYGPLTVITPKTVIAWRSLGPAGRDGFGAASRWDVGAGQTRQ
jgi:hypothetical protein